MLNFNSLPTRAGLETQTRNYWAACDLLNDRTTPRWTRENVLTVLNAIAGSGHLTDTLRGLAKQRIKAETARELAELRRVAEDVPC